MSISRARPRGLLRWLLRLPIKVYRLRLGWLFGHRALRLVHRGRKTGRVHETVLEVFHYDPVRCESFVGSGWGTDPDWYRNIQASPALLVDTGGQRYRPRQRFLSAEEVRRLLMTFRREHPLEERIMLKLFSRGLEGSPDERREALADALCVVAFRPPWRA